MKLLEISNQTENDVKNILRRPIPMSLLGPENCLVEFETKSIGNDFIIKLHVDLFLDTLTLRKEMFQEIADGTLSHLKSRDLYGIMANNDWSDWDELFLSIYQIRLHLDQFKLNLFDYISPPDVTNITAPKLVKDIRDNTDDYSFIGDDVLPIIDLDYNKEYIHQEQRAKNIYKAFRKGYIQGIPYSLPEDYHSIKVIHDPKKFNFENKVIKPHFTVIISVDGEDLETTGDIPVICTKLHQKFDKFDVLLKIR
jgi:hypothetical protein